MTSETRYVCDRCAGLSEWLQNTPPKGWLLWVKHKLDGGTPSDQFAYRQWCPTCVESFDAWTAAGALE